MSQQQHIAARNGYFISISMIAAGSTAKTVSMPPTLDTGNADIAWTQLFPRHPGQQ